MKGNNCPRCGKQVMTYENFFWKHEPYKTAECGSCGARLRRNRRVFLLLPSLAAFTAIILSGAFWLWRSDSIPKAFILFSTIILFVGGAMLTNFMGYAWAGWIPEENK